MLQLLWQLDIEQQGTLNYDAETSCDLISYGVHSCSTKHV